MAARRGFSLLELLVVIGIIAVLLALLLPAVQKVRESASRVQSMNNLKQLSLATQHFADAEGTLPNIKGFYGVYRMTASVHVAILPYIEQGAVYVEYMKVNPAPNSRTSEFVIKTYLDPADPTLPDRPVGTTSFPANALAFAPGSALARSFPDGTSNTILFAEHYGLCSSKLGTFSWFLEDKIVYPVNGSPYVVRRGSFADAPMGDVYPVPSGDPPVSHGAILGLTFQVRPKLEECDPRIAQSPYSFGMLVTLGDGSARVLSGGMSEATYWAAVTPSGGEVLGFDW